MHIRRLNCRKLACPCPESSSHILLSVAIAMCRLFAMGSRRDCRTSILDHMIKRIWPIRRSRKLAGNPLIKISLASVCIPPFCFLYWAWAIVSEFCECLLLLKRAFLLKDNSMNSKCSQCNVSGVFRLDSPFFHSPRSGFKADEISKWRTWWLVFPLG